MAQIEEVVARLKQVRMKLPVAQILPDDSMIDAFMEELGFQIGADYRYFLKEASDSLHNGRSALRIVSNQGGVGSMTTAISDARSAGMPHDLLPISDDNGNYFCLKSDGEIVYWDHNGTTDECWPDLASWIENIWLDDE